MRPFALPFTVSRDNESAGRYVRVEVAQLSEVWTFTEEIEVRK